MLPPPTQSPPQSAGYYSTQIALLQAPPLAALPTVATLQVSQSQVFQQPATEQTPLVGLNPPVGTPEWVKRNVNQGVDERRQRGLLYEPAVDKSTQGETVGFVRVPLSPRSRMWLQRQLEAGCTPMGRTLHFQFPA